MSGSGTTGTVQVWLCGVSSRYPGTARPGSLDLATGLWRPTRGWWGGPVSLSGVVVRSTHRVTERGPDTTLLIGEDEFGSVVHLQVRSGGVRRVERCLDTRRDDAGQRREPNRWQRLQNRVRSPYLAALLVSFGYLALMGDVAFQSIAAVIVVAAPWGIIASGFVVADPLERRRLARQVVDTGPIVAPWTRDVSLHARPGDR